MSGLRAGAAPPLRLRGESRGLTPPITRAPTTRAGRPGTTASRAAGETWVPVLATIVLMGAMLYVMLGTPGDDPNATADTSHVSPLNRWIWIGLLAMAMPVFAKRWRAVLALLRASWPLLLLVGYFALSILWALDPAATIRRLFLTVLQVLLVATVLSGLRRAPVAHVVIACVGVIATLCDVAALILSPATALQPDGFAGLHPQKNEAGLLLMYCCLAAISCLFVLRRRHWRLLLGGAVLAMVFLLVLTRSTTSQSVAIGAALVIPVLRMVARWPRRVIWAIAAVAIGLPLLLLFLWFAGCAVTASDPLLPIRDATFSERTSIWAFMLREIAQRPWLGSGYQSFWSIDAAVQPSLKTGEWFGTYVIINEGHDGYLDLLATCGVLGFLLGLFVFGRGIVIAFQAFVRARPAEAAWRAGTLARPTATFHLAFLLGLVVHNFTESNLFSNNGILGLALLICLLDLEKWRMTDAARLPLGPG
jgi:O-antigen ligase